MTSRWFKFNSETGRCEEIPTEPQARPSLTVLTDEMPVTRHMADGRYYTSKKKFRETTKLYGCIEVGNEKLERRPYKPDSEKNRQAVLRAWDKLENGNRR